MNRKKLETRWKRHHDKQELKKKIDEEIAEIVEEELREMPIMRGEGVHAVRRLVGQG